MRLRHSAVDRRRIRFSGAIAALVKADTAGAAVMAEIA